MKAVEAGSGQLKRNLKKMKEEVKKTQFNIGLGEYEEFCNKINRGSIWNPIRSENNKKVGLKREKESLVC